MMPDEPPGRADTAAPDASPTPLVAPLEFLASCAELGVQLEPGDAERLGLFLALLLEANRSFNLTAVTDPAQAWRRHILDSLTLLPHLAELPPGARVIDVGSGGGVPGMPLACVLPALSFTLLESTGKKAQFLEHTARALALRNLGVLNARAEVAGHDPAHRERYDVVLARAVGRLAVVAELCIPLCSPTGRVLLIKGQRSDEEAAEALQALRLLRAEHVGTVDTPTGRIVVLAKSGRTPRAYPRPDGEPARRPLGAG